MSKEKRRVPKLRFPGFTEDWEQRKLSDITEIVMGQSPSSKNYTDNPNDNILVQGNADLKDGKVVPRLWTKEITKTIDKDGIILTVRAPVGDVAKTDYKVVLGRGVAGIKGNDYIYQFLQKLQNNRYWVSLSSGSTFESINSNDIKDLIIDIPSIEEQTKISMLLNNVNSIITLHQRKLEHLNLKKKALLQKLFPKNGERYPELRFPGFTDAWEQRKADYIFKSVTDKGYPELPVLSASQELGMVYREQNGIDIQHNKKNEASYKRVLPGQFVIHLRSFQGGFAYSEVEGITSPAYTVMSFKNSNEQYGLFWKHIFKSEIFIKRLETITYGIRDGRSISFSDFKSLILQYPSFSEQKMIGDSIAIIERGITLHQQEPFLCGNSVNGGVELC